MPQKSNSARVAFLFCSISIHYNVLLQKLHLLQKLQKLHLLHLLQKLQKLHDLF